MQTMLLRTIFAMAVLWCAVGANDSTAQSASSGDVRKLLVGTWRLVSHSNPDRGAKPIGLIYYDANGYMAAQIMYDGRTKYAGAVPTPDEAKAAVTTYTAYFGIYTIDEKARTVTHHRMGNVHPGVFGDFVRRYEFVSNDVIILRPLESNNVLTWERIKSPRQP